jgi:hypothetical protein
MSENLYVLPAPREPYVELARMASGRLFRKQILKDGQAFKHPKDKNFTIKVTPELQASLVENFHRGYCDTVQFPVTDSKNDHQESVLANLGEVIDVEYEPGRGTYAIIDARKHAEDVGKTILGASAFFSLDYEDTSTGQRVGPTLLHVAATNRPYLTNLEPYQEVVAASNVADSDVAVLSDEDVPDGADTSDEPPNLQEDEPMELEEMLAALKDEHGIDVAALQEAATQLQAAQAELSNVNLSASDGSTITPVDIAEALVELSHTVQEQGETVTALRSRNEQLVRERAEDEVDGLIQVGRVLPKQRDDMIELSLSNRDMFDRLVPENPVVSLSETGVTVFEEPEKAKKHEETVDHYVALAASQSRPRTKRRGE